MRRFAVVAFLAAALGLSGLVIALLERDRESARAQLAVSRADRSIYSTFPTAPRSTPLYAFRDLGHGPVTPAPSDLRHFTPYAAIGTGDAPRAPSASVFLGAPRLVSTPGDYVEIRQRFRYEADRICIERQYRFRDDLRGTDPYPWNTVLCDAVPTCGLWIGGKHGDPVRCAEPLP